jgi:hypothetical protein
MTRLPLFLLSVGVLHAGAPPFTSPTLPVVTSWLGNTHAGAQRWVQQDIAALTVMPDGTVFTNVPWEEGGGNCTEYRDGQAVRTAGHTHGWGFNGGVAIAANSRYVFIGCVCKSEDGNLVDAATWPPKGISWYGISRRQRGDLSQGAPFPGGKGGKGDTLKECFLPINIQPEDAKELARETGILSAAAATDRRLYIANPLTAVIEIYDAETMTKAGSWPCAEPVALQADTTGRIWALHGPETARRLSRYSEEGVRTEVALPATLPRAAAFCLEGNETVLLADAASETIHVMAVSADGTKLEPTGRIGAPGGLEGTHPGRWERGGAAASLPAREPTAPGFVGALRFHRVRAIGTDAQRNLYVSHGGSTGGGSTVLESYSPDGKQRWQVQGLTFVDIVDIDPGDDTRLYSKEEIWTADWSQPPGRETKYVASTQSPAGLTDDPRLHLFATTAWVRRIGGQPVLFVSDMNSEFLASYRFDASRGTLGIPCGFFAPHPYRKPDHSSAWPPHQPQEGAYFWRDADGGGAFEAAEFSLAPGGKNLPTAQGLWVDMDGGLWLATEREGLRYWPCTGLDAKGAPGWRWEDMRTFPHPAGFKDLKRLRYLPATDTLYLGGTTEAHHNQHWKPMGPVVARYDAWLHGGAGDRARWRVTLPYVEGSEGHESCEPMGFDVAGDYLFAPYTGGSRQHGIATGRVEVLRASDGSAVGHFEPSADVGVIGLQDVRESLRAWRRRDGGYLIMIEDDYKAKTVLYRWRP